MEIYKIENKKNGKIYIGKTTRTTKERMTEHRRRSESVIDKAIKKYGIENFSVEVIDEATTAEELDVKEIYWVEHYQSMIPNGYNQCYGGKTSVGFHHRAESKAKMSNAKKDAYNGPNNPFYGKKHSDESKKKMSQKRKNMAHLTDEQIKHVRESHHVKKVRNIETQEVFSSIKEAAEKHNIPPTHITRVCKGKRKSTGGYHWEYADEELK